MKRINRRGRFLPVLLMVMAVIFSFTACSDKKVVLTTGFGKNEVFIIGGETCNRSEVMVYLTNMQNQYEALYGSQIWETSLNGVTLESNVKETVLARIAQIKTLYLMALSRDVELTKDEENLINVAAETYFDSLSADEKDLLDVSEKDIRKMYREMALADKVYNSIVDGIDPEISDDEARKVTMQQILFATSVTNGAGSVLEYSDRVKEELYEKSLNVLERAMGEDQDFMELARECSDAEEIQVTIGKGEVDSVLENAAFDMQNGEIRGIFQTDQGYYILKCINTLDRAETDANKKVIAEKLRETTFETEYDTFLTSLVRDLNEELWGEITFIHDDRVDTADFFSNYDFYMVQ